MLFKRVGKSAKLQQNELTSLMTSAASCSFHHLLSPSDQNRATISLSKDHSRDTDSQMTSLPDDDATAFQISCRSRLVEDGYRDPENFPRLPNRVIYYGTKRYIGEDLGLAQTCEFFKRGQPPGAAFGELHIDLTSKFKYPELYNGLDARSSDVGVWILAPRVAPTQVNFL